MCSLCHNNNPNALVHLYTSIVHPLYEYSCISMINAADCHIEKLQMIQNQALRVVLKCPAYISIKDLHDYSGLPLIKDHLIKFAKGRLNAIRKASPLVEKTIQNYEEVKHIRQNASVLDVLTSY